MFLLLNIVYMFLFLNIVYMFLFLNIAYRFLFLNIAYMFLFLNIVYMFLFLNFIFVNIKISLRKVGDEQIKIHSTQIHTKQIIGILKELYRRNFKCPSNSRGTNRFTAILILFLIWSITALYIQEIVQF